MMARRRNLSGHIAKPKSSPPMTAKHEVGRRREHAIVATELADAVGQPAGPDPARGLHERRRTDDTHDPARQQEVRRPRLRILAVVRRLAHRPSSRSATTRLGATKRQAISRIASITFRLTVRRRMSTAG